jgi:putative ABC transport system substrate-binding protein
MRRREFIAGLGSAVAWPLGAWAQQSPLPLIGYLSSRSPEDTAHLVAAFRQGLRENGYVEGQTATVLYRWGLGQYDRMPAMAAELVRERVSVLVATGAEPAALAAKAATSVIPIVFAIGGDAVQDGLTASYNRPGQNATGISILSPPLETKRLSLFNDVVPKAATIGLLMNPAFPLPLPQVRDVQEGARAIGRALQVLQASTDSEIDKAFASLASLHIATLIVLGDPFFDTRVQKLAALTVRYAVPAIFQFREYAKAGGLMSYGVDLADAYRQVGVYTGRILKGEKPGDLPVVQPTKFEFVINLRIAKALGFQIPADVLALADEVIE